MPAGGGGAIQYSYGTWTSALGEAAIAISREDISAEASGLLVGFRERWTINGVLQAATPAALTLLITALEVAFSRNNQPLALIGPGGSVLRKMAPLGAFGGTRVVNGPEYPESGERSAEYSTYRHYRVIVEGGYAYPNVPAVTILSFHESLSFSGGGPRTVMRQPLTGLPQKQIVADSTPYRVVQRGRAVGLGGYIFPPPPLWPEAEKQDERQITYDNPRKYGGAVGSVYVEWPCEWQYRFEDAAPLDGTPNIVTGI